MTPTPDLRPCPFCGRPVELGEWNNEAWIGCEDCDVAPSVVRAYGPDAIKAWNHRAPQPAIAELREAYEEWMKSEEAPDADACSQDFARLALAIQDIYDPDSSGFPPQVPATPRCSNCLWPAHDGPCGCLVHQKHTANCFACCSAAPDSRTAGRD
jgi:hypothetical protein